MATIVIKDLQESSVLDRQAMRAIAGGSRFGAGPRAAPRDPARRVRLFDLSPGAGKKTPPTGPPTR